MTLYRLLSAALPCLALTGCFVAAEPDESATPEETQHNALPFVAEVSLEQRRSVAPQGVHQIVRHDLRIHSQEPGRLTVQDGGETYHLSADNADSAEARALQMRLAAKGISLDLDSLTIDLPSLPEIPEPPAPRVRLDLRPIEFPELPSLRDRDLMARAMADELSEIRRFHGAFLTFDEDLRSRLDDLDAEAAAAAIERAEEIRLSLMAQRDALERLRNGEIDAALLRQEDLSREMRRRIAAMQEQAHAMAVRLHEEGVDLRGLEALTRIDTLDGLAALGEIRRLERLDPEGKIFGRLVEDARRLSDELRAAAVARAEAGQPFKIVRLRVDGPRRGLVDGFLTEKGDEAVVDAILFIDPDGPSPPDTPDRPSGPPAPPAP